MKTTKTDLLIIFTKNPEKGKVKTRLAEKVGQQNALDIYNFLLQHTHKITKDLEVAKEVYYSEDIGKNDIWQEGNFEKKLQHGKNLGEKMKNAFEEGFKNGYRKIIIIGSDLYDFSTKDLQEAFTSLANKDFVIGPAKDGGYYLLGMHRLESSIFENKEWSTSSVLRDTLDDLRGRNIAILERRNDVDVYEDIQEHEDFQQFLKDVEQ